MRIAIVQIDYQPAYWGPYGSFYREPVNFEEPVIGELAMKSASINEYANFCEKRHLEAHNAKLDAIFNALVNKQVDLLVFPEYSIHPSQLQLVYERAVEVGCSVVAASHIVQSESSKHYEECKLSLSANAGQADVRKSCCPVFFPDGTSTVIFKESQSKWESNIKTDSTKKTFTIPVLNESITVNICIDALKKTVPSSKIMVTPASSPKTDVFYDVGRQLLINERVMVFCNHASFGGSTIFCHIPKSSNAIFGMESHVVPLRKNEESILIVDIDQDQQFSKKGSVETVFPSSVVSVIPILYRNDPNIRNLSDIQEFLEVGKFEEVKNILGSTELIGLAQLKLSHLKTAIETGIIRSEEYHFYTEFAMVDQYSLEQVRFILLKGAIESITQQFTSKPSLLGGQGVNALQKLSVEYERRGKNIPTFTSADEGQDFDDSQFQNRSKGINAFRNCIFSPDMKHKVIFSLEGMKGIGKATLSKKLSKLFSFSSIIISLPESSGWNRLLNSICSALKIQAYYIDANDSQIKVLARKIADSLQNTVRGVLIIRNCGNLLQQHHADFKKVQLFLISLCTQLEGKGIKVILLSDHRIEWTSALDYWVENQKVSPLEDLYVKRIIEYQALSNSDELGIENVPQHLVDICHGSPMVAKLIGTHLGLKKLGLEVRQSLEKYSRYHRNLFSELMDHLGLNTQERLLLKFASVFRVPVQKSAYVNYENFSEAVLQQLTERFFIEKAGELYEVPPLVRRYFDIHSSIDELNHMHLLASKYYETLVMSNGSSHFTIEKAEYIFHSSFIEPNKSELEIRAYSDEILGVAIDLFKRGQAPLALSHLVSVEKWKSHDFLFHLYTAKCYATKGDVGKVDLHLMQCLELYRGEKKGWIFCSIIDNLIRAREFDYAETLIMTAQEIEDTPQLKALFIQLLYHRSQATRREAIDRALVMVNTQYICKRTSKIIITLLLKERLTHDAQREAQKILNVYKGEKWFEEIVKNPNYTDIDDLLDTELDEHVN